MPPRTAYYYYCLLVYRDDWTTALSQINSSFSFFAEPSSSSDSAAGLEIHGQWQLVTVEARGRRSEGGIGLQQHRQSLKWAAGTVTAHHKECYTTGLVLA